MVRRQYGGLLVLILAIACLLWGCGRPEIAKQRLALALDNDIKTLNPVLISDAYSSSVVGLMFSSMVTQNGKTGEIEPELAEKWEFGENGREIIFTLRSGLQWSDGQPLTAADVLFTFQDVIYNPKIPTSSRDVIRVGKQRTLPEISQLDQRRIRFRLSEPFAPFLRSVGGTTILPKHILQKTIDTLDPQGNPQFLTTWAINTPFNQIVGSGPYLISEYRPAERIVLSRNPYYYKKPQPYIPRFIYQIVSSPDAALLRFRAGDLDVFGLRAEDFQLLKPLEQRDRYRIFNGGPDTSQSFMMFNLNLGRDQKGKPFVDPVKATWFQNVQFRQAIAYGINRQAMIDSFYRGLGKPQNSPIPQLSPYYLAEGLPEYKYDQNRAKQLFRQAGFKYNATNRLIDAQGNPVRFSLITGTSGRGVFLGAQIKTDLDQLGITVDFTPIEFGTLIDRLDNSKQWDAALLGFTGGVEPHGSINLWAVDGDNHMFNKGGSAGEPDYPGRVVAPWEQKINDLMIAGAQEIDEAKRRQIYGEFQLLVRQQLPLIHLVTPLYLVAIRDRLQGTEPSAIGRAIWNLDQLKILD
ncbi:MAG: ABC transporter substrate-binding protein [Pseudanabaenaceae cyanobacterium bins.68]|nr:ABC transporter substrate-binding protein [Pseudanabaenaceae cyanobacterium bins.68]